MSKSQDKSDAKSYRELEVGKKMTLLKIKIGRLGKKFPSEEIVRLTDQIIRSSRGINSCIAEGMEDIREIN